MEVVKFVEVSLQKVKTTIDDDILRFSELVVHVIWKYEATNFFVNRFLLFSCIIVLFTYLFFILEHRAVVIQLRN